MRQRVRHSRFLTEMKLHKSLVLYILLYDCGSWTMIAELTKRIKTFKTKG